MHNHMIANFLLTTGLPSTKFSIAVINNHLNCNPFNG